MMQMKRLSVILVITASLAGCGGGSRGAWSGDDDDDPPAPGEVPSAPVSLVANAGDEAISLGWGVPTTNATGTLSYTITLTPNAASARYTIIGTRALVRGVSNDTTYTVAVTATNSAGTGPAASIQAKPTAAAADDYTVVEFGDNPAQTHGFADPAPLRTSGGRIWLAYTDVEANGSGQILRSATRLAYSEDSGASYIFSQEVGEPVATGAPLPTGEWHYRTPWLIEDSSDPDANRRFKLFAHKYFFNTVGNNFDYGIGAIAMWTAAAPDGTWSEEEIVLGWADTPNALQPPARIEQLSASLQSCLWIDEGSATAGSAGIDFAFSCAIDNAPFGIQRSVVLLRSTDHAQSFSYVATPLQPAEALAYDADSFGMPALLPAAGNAPVLLASPIDNLGNALGCVLFPIADSSAGALFIEDDAPLALQALPAAGQDSGGCGWDRGIPANGILMHDRDGSDHAIRATGKSL